MADIFTKEKRSKVMSMVSRHDTPQEILVRKFIFKNGFRFRKNYRKLPGSPDIVLTRLKVIIFIHGCFWHGHNCRSAALPKSNIEFWKLKIESNKKRDKRKIRELKRMGWTVFELWQCQLKTEQLKSKTLNALLIRLSNIRMNATNFL